MTPLKTLMLGTSLILGATSAAQAQQDMQPSTTASIAGVDGTELGEVSLTETASGQVLVDINLSGLEPGVHGIHLHETGDCSAADFSSAGGHIPGDAEHGVMSANGPHPGDMPNATVAADGTLKLQVFLNGLSMDEMINDDDGAAFIVHSGQDDYTSQPSGDAGDRVACGTFSSET